MAKKKKVGKTVIVKKKWFTIRAPKMFNEAKVGETYAATPDSLVGKDMTIMLSAITGEHSRQSLSVSFKMNAVDNNELKTNLTGLQIGKSSLKRAVRRNRTKVSDSFLVRTKNQQTIRCKPLLVTKFKTNASICTALKKKARDMIALAASKNDFEGLCQEILDRKLQKSMQDQLKKIFPLSYCDIRTLKIENIAKA